MESYNKNNLCRLCLHSNKTLVGIFEENNKHGYVAAEVIEDLLHLQVSKTDCYPRLICEKCLDKLTEFKQFKSQCHISLATYDNVYSAEEVVPLKEEDDGDSEESIIFVNSECNDERKATVEQDEDVDVGEGMKLPQEGDCLECDPFMDLNEVQGEPRPNKLAKMTYGKGVPLRSQSRELVYALRDHFLMERYNRGPLMDCEKVVERTAAALSMSTSSVAKICEEIKDKMRGLEAGENRLPRERDCPVQDPFMDTNGVQGGPRPNDRTKMTYGEGIPLSNQSRELVYTLRDYFQKEKDNGGPLIDCYKVVERTAAAFAIGRVSVVRICREIDEKIYKALEAGEDTVRPDSPGKKRPNRKKPLTGLDSVRGDAIRHHVHEYYKRNELPSLKKLLKSLKEENLFHGGKTSLCKVLKDIGCNYRRKEEFDAKVESGAGGTSTKIPQSDFPSN